MLGKEQMQTHYGEQGRLDEAEGLVQASPLFANGKLMTTPSRQPFSRIQ
jgi:hypothetical protein